MPTLLTVEKLRDADWPREALEDIVSMPDEPDPRADSQYRLLDGARPPLRPRHRSRRVRSGNGRARFANTCACPAWASPLRPTIATSWPCGPRRATCRLSGSRLLPRAQLRRSARIHGPRAEPPWLLKPRAEASALGIRKIEAPGAALARARRAGRPSRAISCWSSLCPATSSTSTRS